jgi:hypothetical protein
VYIVVNAITELNVPTSLHAKKLSRLVRECFANHLSLTIDFESVTEVSEDFFHELFLPLAPEFGVGYLKSKLTVVNVAPDIEQFMTTAFSDLDAYFKKSTTTHAKHFDEDIYAINLAWLVISREVSRNSPLLARLVLGIDDDEMISALSQLSFCDIQYLAQTNWLCFSPRFSTNFIKCMGTHQRQAAEVMIGFSEFLNLK